MLMPTDLRIDPIITDTKAAKGESVQGRYAGNGYGMDSMAIPPIMINLMGSENGVIQWSYYPRNRDMQLRRLYKAESLMSGAVYSLVARVKSLQWRVEGGRNLKSKYQNILETANNGAGLPSLIETFVTDILTQDNGGFIELVGGGNPLRPLPFVTAMNHLDAGQCQRTHDPEYPVIYSNPMTGELHKLHRSRVVAVSSFTQPDELARGVGYCGVSRVIRTMQYMQHVAAYKDEKVSGNFKRGIIHGNGYTPKTFEQAMNQANELDDRRGNVYFRGIPILLSQQTDSKLDMLDLASLPDGFEYESEQTLYVYALALGFGVDAREFWPATSSGATKADASIQHLKSQGKGFADLIRTIEDVINQYVLPSGLTFVFDYTDDEQDKQATEINGLKADNIDKLLEMGVIDKRGAQILCVLRGVITPQEMEAIANAASGDETPLDANGDELVLAELPEQDIVLPPPPPNDGKLPVVPNDKPVPALKAKAANFAALKADKIAYESVLTDLLSTWGKGVVSTVGLSSKIDTLKKDYIDTTKRYTSNAYRQGANGNPTDPDGIDKLRSIGDESIDYFADSFLVDLKQAIIDKVDGLSSTAIDTNTPEQSENSAIADVIAGFGGRMALYAGAYWQSIWAGTGAAVKASEADRDRKVKRELDPTADNCKGCIDKAGEYPSYETMVNEVGLPADGSTVCLGHCHCHITIEQDGGGFDSLSGSGASIDYSPLY